jgi:hypothetical protein
MRRSSPSKKVDRFAHVVIVAEAVFGERSIDLIARRVSVTSHRPRSQECLNFVINKHAIAISWTTIAIF